jgi:hypothetical protein
MSEKKKEKKELSCKIFQSFFLMKLLEERVKNSFLKKINKFTFIFLAKFFG